MKICFFADGESIHTVRWCQHFHALGHEIHLITFKKVAIENIHVHFVDTGKITVSGGNWRVLLKYKEIKSLLKKIKPTIFHAHYATSYGITGALTNYHPYVITALGTDVLISPNQSILYKVLLKYAFAKADWITAMADHMKTAILNLGVNKSKVDTVPFGIDPLVFNMSNRAVPTDKFVVTSTRNFEKIYNIPHLLKAVAVAKKQIPNLHLNLIGNGSLRQEVLAELKSLALESCCTVFGKIPQPAIAKELNHSHLFISVSLSDGNNISLNEAMACGTLPIVTNIPANTQWIEDGKNGFLVDIDDVHTLAEKMIYCYKNYRKIQDVAQTMNQNIINEKALWSVNMALVEKKYHQLANHI